MGKGHEQAAWIWGWGEEPVPRKHWKLGQFQLQ